MLVKPPRVPAPLAGLRDPEIPAKGLKPLPSGAWTINVAALKAVPEKGLLVSILEWWNMSALDRVLLLFDGSPVDQYVIKQTDVGKRVTLWVAPSHFKTGYHTLSYEVRRVSHDPERHTNPLNLFYKHEIPGGQDLDDEDGVHSNLYMDIPEEIVEDGIDKDNVSDGVNITIKAHPDKPSKPQYPNIFLGDIIYLYWGGIPVPSAPVTQAQIDDPDANPIIIHVSEAVILEAGDSDENGVAVTYIIHDLVNNEAEDWCEEIRIVVDTDESRLEAPIVEQADGDKLDLEDLIDEDTGKELDIHLMVWASSAVTFHKDDVIIMSVRGTTLDGKPVNIKVRQTIIKNPPLVVDVYLPHSAARLLTQTQVIFSYELERAGQVIKRSKGRFINITGEPVRLAAPIAVDAKEGALDPALSSLRIRIPFDERIVPGTGIELILLGTRPDQSTYNPDLEWYLPEKHETDNPDGFIITLERAHLEEVNGGDLTCSYVLLTEEEDGNIARRLSEQGTKLRVGEAKRELVKPTVLGETDGTLEPKDLVNGTSEVMCPSPAIKPTEAKDKVTWQLHDASGALLFEDSKILSALTAGKPVKFPLDAAFVQQYFEANRGQKLSVSYSIWRSAPGTTHYSDPLEFSIGLDLKLEQQPAILQAEADGITLQPEKAKDALTAVIPSEGLLPTDELSVTWTGNGTGGSHTTQAKPVSETGFNVALSVPVLAFNLGKTVRVTFTITRNGKTVTSPVLTLNVGLLPIDSLIPATIVEADANGVLDVVALGTKTATVRGMSWPLMAVGQQVWMALVGKKADGTTHSLPLWNGSGAQVNATWINQRFWPHNAPNAYFKALGDATELRVTFKVSMDKSNNEATAVVFPDRVYTIRAFEEVTPTITSVKGQPSGMEIPDGSSTFENRFILSGRASKNQQIEVYLGTVPQGRFTADASTGVWTTTVITGLAEGQHRFTATALYGSQPSSPAWIFTVIEKVTPTITSVKGTINKSEISHGAVTSETFVDITGTAGKNQQIQVYDGATLLGPAAVDSEGKWTFTATRLSATSHSFTARSGELSSSTRTLTVRVILTENFDNQPNIILKPNMQLALSSMTITNIQGPGDCEIWNLSAYYGPPLPIPGRRAGQVFCLNATLYQDTRIDLRSAYSKISFWHSGAATSYHDIYYYNAAGELLGQVVLGNSLTEGGTPRLHEFSAIGITRMEIKHPRGYKAMFIDHFQFQI